jgi:hypothetical protein
MRVRLIAALLASLVAAGGARAEDGRDLTGLWTNISITRLTRPPGVARLVVDAAEAKAMAGRDFLVRDAERDAGPSDVNDNLLADGNAGDGYNAFWMDPGRTLARVNGEYRTSWIVEPADGQLPLSPEGRARIGRLRAERRTDEAAGPEALTPWDRCLISSRGAGGPGMLNTVYNGNYQFVLTPGALVVVVEQVHDARIIPIYASRAAARAAHGGVPRWFGDSVAWWEGRTLVAETTRVHPEQGAWGPIFLSERGIVTERFTRVAAGEMSYAFTVEDPAYYTRPWRAEMVMTSVAKPIYEFACHEGNYAMSGVLGGARAQEARR